MSTTITTTIFLARGKDANGFPIAGRAMKSDICERCGAKIYLAFQEGCDDDAMVYTGFCECKRRSYRVEKRETGTVYEHRVKCTGCSMKCTLNVTGFWWNDEMSGNRHTCCVGGTPGYKGLMNLEVVSTTEITVENGHNVAKRVI